MDASPSSALLNSRAMRLPMMVPDANDSADVPVVLYSLKLSDETVESMLAGETTLMFNDPENGVMSIDGETFQFTAHAVGDTSEKDKTFALSADSSDIRTLGPITADIDTDKTMSARAASGTEKPTIDPANAVRNDAVEICNNIQSTASSDDD